MSDTLHGRTKDQERAMFADFLLKDGFPQDQIEAAVGIVLEAAPSAGNPLLSGAAQDAYLRWMAMGFPG